MEWTYNEQTNQYEGTYDDTVMYLVEPDCDNPDQWQWVTADPDGYGAYGFDTADEAMADADSDWNTLDHSEEVAQPTAEDIDEMYGDWLYHARRDDPEYF